MENKTYKQNFDIKYVMLYKEDLLELERLIRSKCNIDFDIEVALEDKQKKFIQWKNYLKRIYLLASMI